MTETSAVKPTAGAGQAGRTFSVTCYLCGNTVLCIILNAVFVFLNLTTTLAQFILRFLKPAQLFGKWGSLFSMKSVLSFHHVGAWDSN